MSNKTYTKILEITKFTVNLFLEYLKKNFVVQQKNI